MAQMFLLLSEVTPWSPCATSRCQAPLKKPPPKGEVLKDSCGKCGRHEATFGDDGNMRVSWGNTRPM